MSFDNIPLELRELPQWIVWKYEENDGEKPTKIPYNPATGRMASVTNSKTWVGFEQAVAAAPNYSGIGFILTRDDPYTIIDLDDSNCDPETAALHLRIFEHFDSWAERSPSKTGLHIVIKGQIPSGRRRGKVELYFSERYMTFTGDVFADKPIAERQEFLTQLWHEMGKDGGAALYDGNSPQLHEDSVIIERALAAVNGPKFKTLLDGQWTDLYGSQSEADFAFVDIIAFYTQNREQLARIFRASPLGQRDKAKRNDYIEYMVSKSFDRMLPPVNYDSIYNAIEAEIARAKAVVSPTLPAVAPPPVLSNQIPPPPGLLGQLARYIHDVAPRPVPEVALVGAMGLMAGVCGRAWNVSGTGLNQYILLIANTGAGKEGLARGVSRIVDAVGTAIGGGMGQNATFAEFIGPGEIASGQALLKELGRRTHPSFVSILGEFGKRFKNMTGEKVSPADNMLNRAWLDLYNKSGMGDRIQPSIYSDKANATDIVLAPAFSMIGESTGETFYGNLNEAMISDGLLPRFTIVEYYGKRPPRNKRTEIMPPVELVEKLAKIGAMALSNIAQNIATNVGYDAEAEAYLDAFDTYCDDQINSSGKDVVKQLWNRAHLKVLKLAALIAVGVDCDNPIITMNEAEWACAQVERDVRNLLFRFEAGTIGFASTSLAGEDMQVTTLLKSIKRYVTCEYHEIHKYGPKVEMHRDKIIPHSYFQKTLSGVGTFKMDRNGAKRAIQRTIETLIENGDLQQCPPGEISAKYQFAGKCYALVNPTVATMDI